MPKPKLTLIHGEGKGSTPIPTNPTVNMEPALAAVAKFEGILDGITASFGPDTHPLEKVFIMRWRRELDEMRAQLKEPLPDYGGGER